MASATKQPKVKIPEEIPFKLLWMNSCYQQTLLPDAPWHKVIIDYYIPISISTQVSSPDSNIGPKGLGERDHIGRDDSRVDMKRDL